MLFALPYHNSSTAKSSTATIPTTSNADLLTKENFVSLLTILVSP
jgi:hypothetical protein